MLLRVVSLNVFAAADIAGKGISRVEPKRFSGRAGDEDYLVCFPS